MSTSFHYSYSKANRTLVRWEKAKLSLPEYIELSAKGQAKISDGEVFVRNSPLDKPVSNNDAALLERKF
jgi:hypothetical protein